MRLFQRARTVAAYEAFDGEPSLKQLFDDPRNRLKQFLLPVIRSEHIRFAPRSLATRMQTNRFGIAEPRVRAATLSRNIDIVLVPVVAFDASGKRLGMGSGYYDRRFAALRTRRCYFRPRLLGIAYEAQRADAIPDEVWDVPLWGIVTERSIRRFDKE